MPLTNPSSQRPRKAPRGQLFFLAAVLVGPQAITATAHKLARIVYHLLSTKESYNESVFKRCDEETLRRAEFRLRKQAAQLGFRVTPAENG
jgi:transposase